MYKFCQTILTILVLALLAAAPALAQECSPLLGIYNADNVTLYAGQGNSCRGATFKPEGLLYTTTATVATAAGTTEQTLGTYSLPGGSLDAVGRKLRIRFSFTAAANGNNKTFRLYFGASVISSGVQTINGVNGSGEMIVTKSGASTQIVYANMTASTTVIAPYVNAAGADADTAAIVIKFTGQDGTNSAGDIVLNDLFIEYMN